MVIGNEDGTLKDDIGKPMGNASSVMSGKDDMDAMGDTKTANDDDDIMLDNIVEDANDGIDDIDNRMLNEPEQEIEMVASDIDQEAVTIVGHDEEGNGSNGEVAFEDDLIIDEVNDVTIVDEVEDEEDELLNAINSAQ